MNAALKNALWMVPGTAAVLLLLVFVLHYHRAEKREEQLASRTKRVELVDRMRVALGSASEAEKSAVLAITDQDSTTFADQARAATAEVEQARRELEELLQKGDNQRERDLLGQFSQAFNELRRIDDELLGLAVKNTNLKAYRLAFGPAADEVNQLSSVLSHLVSSNMESPDAKTVMLLAFAAEIGALRIQTLLAPHIAEESDEKMNDLEAAMSEDDRQIRDDLDRLAALPGLGSQADIATAVASYQRFSEVIGKILPLSRENTNVRSLAMSLNQKRMVVLLSQTYLKSLQQEILQEPIVDVMYARPANPR